MASFVKVIGKDFKSMIRIGPVDENLVCEFLEAVQAECSPALDYLSACQLNVYLPGTTKFSEESLDAFASVPPSTPDDPIIVVVPDPQEEKTGMRVILLF